ncbi:MAG: DnaA N-terminal domain-containing protein [Christensenellales bacterium]
MDYQRIKRGVNLLEDYTLLWQQVCMELKEDLSDFSFHTWVEPLHAVSLENNRLILVAPAANIRENLMHRCYEMIVNTVREKTNNASFTVKFYWRANGAVRSRPLQSRWNKSGTR